jgi:uncharacterized protein with ATP-grasp and redox domains
MKTALDCIPCILRQSLEAARFVSDDPGIHEQVMRHVLRMTVELDMNQPPPVVGQAIHRKLRQMTGVRDPYRSAKWRFNQMAMDILPELITAMKQAPEPLLAAARLAIAANVMDLGVAGDHTEAETRAALRGSLCAPIHGDWREFCRAVADASNILYLTDNAGEIAVDRLLIEELGPGRVTVAVRGSPVINDATIADAHELHLDELVEVIDNGSDAPGTVLEDCSPLFRERFNKSDLIIAKGQGNFETLSNVSGNIFFLLKVKCLVIASHVGLPIGTHALVWSKRLNSHKRMTTIPNGRRA